MRWLRYWYSFDFGFCIMLIAVKHFTFCYFFKWTPRLASRWCSFKIWWRPAMFKSVSNSLFFRSATETLQNMEHFFNVSLKRYAWTISVNLPEYKIKCNIKCFWIKINFMFSDCWLGIIFFFFNIIYTANSYNIW